MFGITDTKNKTWQHSKLNHISFEIFFATIFRKSLNKKMNTLEGYDEFLASVSNNFTVSENNSMQGAQWEMDLMVQLDSGLYGNPQNDFNYSANASSFPEIPVPATMQQDVVPARKTVAEQQNESQASSPVGLSMPSLNVPLNLEPRKPFIITTNENGSTGQMKRVIYPVRRQENPTLVKRQRLMETDQRDAPRAFTGIKNPIMEQPDASKNFSYHVGVEAWKNWVYNKNYKTSRGSDYQRPFKTELLHLDTEELNYSLHLFVRQVRNPSGIEYTPDVIFNFVLNIQQYLFENGRRDNIFTDHPYEGFTASLNEAIKKFFLRCEERQIIVRRVAEEHLWECKQLGVFSPQVLVNTLMYYNTKYFDLDTIEQHLRLSFTDILKLWKPTPPTSTHQRAKTFFLRYYPSPLIHDTHANKKFYYDLDENHENPHRCPVNLYDFYLSRCPKNVKVRSDVFYLQPDTSCVATSPVWFSTKGMGKKAIEKVFNRIKMVREVKLSKY